MADYDDGLALDEALSHYFEANGFGEDGGYSAKWVTGMFGPVPFAFPNIEARVRAVRYHDLHHVVTGYETDGVGEGEISAWEVATGCADFWAAWLLNLTGMAVGFALAPGRIFRAFVRGRRSQNLYRFEYGPELLAHSVGEMRAQLLAGGTHEDPEPADRIAFASWLALGIATGLAQLALLLLPLIAAVLWLW
jgi:hypothetical protein